MKKLLFCVPLLVCGGSLYGDAYESIEKAIGTGSKDRITELSQLLDRQLKREKASSHVRKQKYDDLAQLAEDKAEDYENNLGISSSTKDFTRCVVGGAASGLGAILTLGGAVFLGCGHLKMFEQEQVNKLWKKVGKIFLPTGLVIGTIGSWFFKKGYSCSTQKDKIVAFRGIAEHLTKKAESYSEKETE